MTTYRVTLRDRETQSGLLERLLDDGQVPCCHHP